MRRANKICLKNAIETLNRLRREIPILRCETVRFEFYSEFIPDRQILTLRQDEAMSIP